MGFDMVFGYPRDGINCLLAAGAAPATIRGSYRHDEPKAAFETVAYAKLTGRLGLWHHVGAGMIHLSVTAAISRMLLPATST